MAHDDDPPFDVESYLAHRLRAHLAAAQRARDLEVWRVLTAGLPQTGGFQQTSGTRHGFEYLFHYVMPVAGYVACPALPDHDRYATCPLCRGHGVVPELTTEPDPD
jgi:hypothetical protein